MRRSADAFSPLTAAAYGELTLQQLKIKNAKLKITETQDPTASSQEAERCFLKAIDIAQRQQAKSLELRATMS